MFDIICDNFVLKTFHLISDTAEGIAQELITAGLVDSKDFEVVAANLEKLILNQTNYKSIVFALVRL